jgi:Holliday junction resolvasome RuvABC endonuclease subunit
MKTILALDLGTKCGYALISTTIKSPAVRSGTKDFKATRFESADRRFVNFRNFLNQIRSGYPLGINTIYFEEVRKHIGVDAAHCYGGFKAILTAFCEDKKISYQGVPVGTIKKHITGKGNSDKSKVILAVQEKGYNPKDDNEADAIALLDYAMIQEEITYTRKDK